MATTTVTLTYPNGQGQSLLDYFAACHRYQVNLTNELGESIPNPETKTQFLDRKVKEFIRDSIRAGKAVADANAARELAIQTIDSQIPIT